MADNTTQKELGIIEVNSELLTDIGEFMMGNEYLEEVDCPFPHVMTAIDAFSHCTKLKTFKGSFPKLSSAYNMLENTGITTFIMGETENSGDVYMPRVTHAIEMLSDCKHLNTVTLHLPSAEYVGSILDGCTSVTTLTVNLPIYEGNNSPNDGVGDVFTIPESTVTFNGTLPKAKYIKLTKNIKDASITLNSVTNGEELIKDATSLSNITATLSSVTSFGGKSFPTGLRTANLTFGSLTDGSNLFNGSSVSNLSLSGLGNLSNGESMFSNCSGMSSWEWKTNLPNLSNGQNMFSSCNGLKTVEAQLGTYEKDGKNTKLNASNMFKDCSNLETAYLSLSSLVNGYQMFRDCKKLYWFKSTEIGDGNFKKDPDLSNLENGSHMFYGAGASNIETFYSQMPSLRDGYMMFFNSKFSAFGNADDLQVDMSKLINGSHMFSGRSSDMQNIFNRVCAKTPELVDGSYMFAYNANLKGYDETALSVDIKLGNTNNEASIDPNINAKLNNASSMFEGCTSLSKINHENINLSGVVNAERMFKGCTKLTSFEGSLYSLLAAENMFCGCALDKVSLDYISLHINDLVGHGFVLYDNDGKRQFGNESDWKYKQWDDSASIVISEGELGGDAYSSNIKEVQIEEGKRGTIHVDYNESVTDELKVAFERSLKTKGWIVTTCTGANTNLSISEDNKTDDGTKSYVEDIDAWKSQRYQRYNMKITSITNTVRDGKVVGVMHGTSDVS